MTKTFIKKMVTLMSSGTLVVLFLLYRVGVFDRPDLNDAAILQSSHNGGNITPTGVDSIKPPKKDSQLLMLPSSKSLVLARQERLFLDSLRLALTAPKYRKQIGKSYVSLLVVAAIR